MIIIWIVVIQQYKSKVDQKFLCSLINRTRLSLSKPNLYITIFKDVFKARYLLYS